MTTSQTKLAVPPTLWRLEMIKKLIAAYDPALVSTVLSPNESMTGDNYIWVGQSAVEAIVTCIGASRLNSVSSVLDLPCGHGRVLRHLVDLFPGAQFDACDLDEDGMAFCAKEFGATVVPGFTDLTKTVFPRTYDLIWVGSLFTHVDEARTRAWLKFLADQLTDKGIIVGTFHGRWSMRMQELIPYTDAERWAKVVGGYQTGGYGFVDYAPGLGHDFVPGSYGVSAIQPNHLRKMVENIPGVRIIHFQEKGWGENQDVMAFGKPAWEQLPESWPT